MPEVNGSSRSGSWRVIVSRQPSLQERMDISVIYLFRVGTEDPEGITF
jgi:hypothetical protein